MSKKSRDDLRTTVDQPFERVESDEVGYEPSHVDAFMARARKAYEGSGTLSVEDVRQARFATVNGGYATDQVDDALDRLEDALADSEREAFVSERGDEDWAVMLSERTEELLGRADRAPGERFRRPSRADAQAYDVDQVDEFCDRLAAALRAPEGEAELDADDVRRAAFASAEGRKGYEEGQVDAYLDAAVDVLLRRG